jgi:fucose permease
MFFMGAGTGTYEGVTDAMLFELHTAKAGLHINVNHFFVTVGSILIAVYLLFLQMNWRLSTIQAGIAVLLLAAFFALAKVPNRNRGGESWAEKLKILTREKTMAVLFVATALAVGAELSAVGILTTFLMEMRGFTLVTSKIGLIVFLLGMGTGRIFIGLFSQKEQHIPYFVVGLFGLSTLLFAALFQANLGGLTWVVLYLAGIAFSALLPLMLTLAGLTYPQSAGTAMGAIKVAIPVGGILMPFLMSMVAEHSSFQVSLLIFPVAFFLGLLLFLSSGYLRVSRTLPHKPT